MLCVVGVIFFALSFLFQLMLLASGRYLFYLTYDDMFKFLITIPVVILM